MQEYTFYVVVNDNGDYLTRQFDGVTYIFVSGELCSYDLYDEFEKATYLAGEYGGKVKRVKIIVEEKRIRT